MTMPSWGEMTTTLAMFAGGVGWLVKRRDRIAVLEAEIATLRTDLERAMAEAEKTQRSHSEALDAKNAEIAEWRRQSERHEDRITTLEDRLYTQGGRA